MPIWTPLFDVAIARMNSGERRVAEQLENLLPPDVQVIPGFRWQVIKSNRAPVDLETDFVIFWPKRGVIILEVKSGSVDWDPRVGSWTGLVSRSPTEQARGSRNDLVERLASITGPNETANAWRQRVQAFPLFPDVDRDRFPPTMDGFERDCILGRNELRNIGRVLERHTRRTTDLSGPLTSERCTVLVQTLCPAVHLAPRGSHIIEDESKSIEWATDRGLRLLAQVRDQRCVFVSGSAGTGKTILGLSAMKTWSEAGSKAFYVSTNPHLARFLREEYPKQSDSIYSLASFLRDIVKCDTPPGDPLSEDDLLDALSRPATAGRVADVSLVLDEAQDLSRDALEGLITLCEYRRLWILYDDQQVLQRGERVEEFEARLDSATRGRIAPIRLDRNLRNTQKIGEYVAEWVQTDYQPYEGLPIGETPSIRRVGDDSAHDTALKDLLAELLTEKKFATEDIVILSCLSISELRSKYTSNDGYRKFGRKMRYLGEAVARGEIRIASVLDFKGQEASVVILVDTRHATALNAFYIGGSRAKLRLFVIAYEKHVERPSTNLVASVQGAGFRI